MDHLRYPIGRPPKIETVSIEMRNKWLDDLRQLPSQMMQAYAALPEGGLDQTYRPGGWTIRQVIHHVADSHLNSIIRFKWALTEDRPLIKTYNEKAWAELPDVTYTPVEVSLQLLESMHKRWSILLENLKEEDWQRELIHPENGPWRLDHMLGHYSWHGRHHLGHINLVLHPDS